ncbi:MAG: TIGR02678 family protein [Hyphomonadaceae bacterium]|nr:TIGR02678 family protein [Clostridia bacterium]
MREIEILLDRFWISRGHEKDLYYQIKDKASEMKDFFETKLGYKLIINPTLIKLEKLPGKAESWMGIKQFDRVRDYVFLCLVLVFLEDREKNEQFVLSQLTEFIQSQQIGEEAADWTLYSHRKSIVKVLRFAEALKMIFVNDGDNNSFMDGMNNEVLYESTGLSKYFVRNFMGNLLHYRNIEDIENGEWLDLQHDRGVIRKNRVYRRLLMSPAVYSEGGEDQDYLYIKNFRNIIAKDIERAIDGRLHLHKNGAFVIINADKSFESVFPDTKAISDIVLQLNGVIVSAVKSGQLKRLADDVIVLSKAGLQSLIEQCREDFVAGWSKEYREMQLDKLFDEIVSYMQGFSMLTMKGLEIRILPIVGKIIGTYPTDFESEAVKENE